MSIPQFTFRDRVKTACLGRCIDAGMDEEEIVETFRTAIRFLKSEEGKTAALGWLSPAAKSIGTLAMLGIPVAAISAGAVGNVLGNTFKNVEIGRVPATEELKLLDEIAMLKRNADEIVRRTEEKENERKARSKPSVRRLF